MMRWTRFVPAAAACSFALALCGGAFAETPEEQAARTLFKEGLSLYEAHDYGGAIEKYRAAYARWKNPKILANIGTAAWEAGRYVDAAQAYDQFLDDAPPADPTRAEVEKARKDVLVKVGTLDIRVTGGSAALTVDGKSLETAHPERVRIEPGVHSVEGVGAGGLHGRQLANVLAGGTAVVELTLYAGTAPVPTSSPPPERPGHKFDFSTRTPLPWIAAGIGVAGFVASGVFYYGLRGSAVNDLEQSCLGQICPASSQDAIDRANTFGLISAISLGVGIVGVGTGVVLFALDKKADAQEDKPAVALSLAATPALAGAAVRVRY